MSANIVAVAAAARNPGSGMIASSTNSIDLLGQEGVCLLQHTSLLLHHTTTISCGSCSSTSSLLY